MTNLPYLVSARVCFFVFLQIYTKADVQENVQVKLLHVIFGIIVFSTWMTSL